jgi:hypothetical protein
MQVTDTTVSTPQLSVSDTSSLSNINVTGIATVLSDNLKIRNPANTFEYSIVGSGIVANRELTLPVITTTDTVAVLGLSQTFSADQTFSSVLTATGHLSLTGAATGQTHVFGSSQTTAGITIGGTSGTGAITLGRSTASQTTNIQAGITASGNTKTINFGTSGASNSSTLINIGPTDGIGTVVINSGTSLLLGSASETGTDLQRLQVIGGAYVSGSAGIGTTNPTSKLHVIGDARITGILTANRIFSEIYGEFVGGATISGTNIVGTALSISGISTIGILQISSGIVTATAGIITYYGDGSNLSGINVDISIIDDTSTNDTFYVSMASTTSGNLTNLNVSSTKLTFNPSTGNLVAGGTVTANSDEKLKTNIQTISNALEKVLSLRGVEYDRIDTGDHQIGVIAQEVENIIPHVVYPKQPSPSYETKSVAYSNLIGLLIEAVKELNKKIEEK